MVCFVLVSGSVRNSRMRRFLKPVAAVALFLSLVTSVICADYKEHLHIHPLQSRHTLVHFQFSVDRSLSDINAEHFDLFPKSLDKLLREYAIDEFHLALTKGGWQYARWGVAPVPAPHGAELTVFFQNSTSSLHSEDKWKSMTNTISGLFCASLSFMHTPAGHNGNNSLLSQTDQAVLPFRPQAQSFSPSRSFRPWSDFGRSGERKVRHSVLAGETVCTENLTPWIKLLPCRTHAGLGSLFAKPTNLYNVDYHSMGLHHFHGENGGDKLLFSLTLVIATADLQVTNPSIAPEFNVAKVFKSNKLETCPSASATTVSIHKPDGQPTEVKKFAKGEKIRATVELTASNTQAAVDSLSEVDWIHVSRWLAGWGQQGGQLMLRFQNKLDHEVSGIYYHSIPWYLRFFYHTMKSYMNGEVQPLSASSPIKIAVRPTSDRGLSSIVELDVTLPPKSDLLITIEFERNFIHWTEFPPDAHRGFEVGSGVWSVRMTAALKDLLAAFNRYGYTFAVDKSEWGDSALSNAHFVHIYTDTIAIVLPTPDFSMPYNVITMTSTIWVLFFGSMVNALLRRYKDLYAGANEFVDDRPISKILRKLSSLFQRKTN